MRVSQLETEATWNSRKDGHHSGEFQGFVSRKVCVGSWQDTSFTKNVTLELSQYILWYSAVQPRESIHAHIRQNYIQASLVIRDLTLRVFAITRFRGKKAVRKLYSNFAVTEYGGGVTVWRAHQLVTSYQYQCEREC